MSDAHAVCARTAHGGVDPALAYELHPEVALRPEPFGALAYHYGNRRLTFLRSLELVEVVESLALHRCLDDALRAAHVDEARRPAIVGALCALEHSEVIRAR